ncbi:MAG: hypothetical protein CVU78_01340 [Elusimicrobia bacterium HGW-Elusimicrobia-2]|nr:MAG: hypothetical protein CVU78_01340 [Elusimicrobia bacterium HGW-Elusimicrobia-2]
MLLRIKTELRHHAPFTAAGAASGIILMIIFSKISSNAALNIFHVFHPGHVFLSALVTSSMYQLHKCGKLKEKCSLLGLLAIGYIGSVGIATLSDSLIPYIGEWLLGLPNRGMHVGFIEEWYIVNPLALAGIAVAYFSPSTKFPHAGHVLLSTWASLFHMISAGGNMGAGSYAVVFVFLFIAVWIPCCVSDIVFPLLFVKE